MSATMRVLGHPAAGMLLGVAVLVAVVWRLGTGPVVHGLASIGPAPLAAAALIGVPVTLCCAWRWSLVARGLGIALSLPAALAGCYRAQFLNTALPGGVLGDVNRAVRHGRDAGSPGRAAGAVALERFAGQVVQLVLATGVLLVVPSPARAGLRSAATVVGVVLVVGGLLALAAPRGAAARRFRRRWTAVDAVRLALLDRGRWPGILLTSVGVLVGCVVTFIVAARAVGVTAPSSRLLPLALIVLVAMAVPANVAGWGPREGAAAWAFGTAGLGADLGLATAVAYGVLVFVAALPGAVVLVGVRRRREEPLVTTEGVVHG
ncbi:MAG: lysylphosphatidylglycerol synthase transmembrane domain-containing protein [Nocardioides sp.]